MQTIKCYSCRRRKLYFRPTTTTRMINVWRSDNWIHCAVRLVLFHELKLVVWALLTAIHCRNCFHLNRNHYCRRQMQSCARITAIGLVEWQRHKQTDDVVMSMVVSLWRPLVMMAIREIRYHHLRSLNRAAADWPHRLPWNCHYCLRSYRLKNCEFLFFLVCLSNSQIHCQKENRILTTGWRRIECSKTV